MGDGWRTSRRDLVTVTLTAANWAWLRERLETFARYAETNAEQFAGLLRHTPVRRSAGAT